MFGNQDELIKAFPSKMIINIVGNNYLSEYLISNCLDISEGDYMDKLRVINYSNIDDMIQTTKIRKDKVDDNQIYGLLNLNWIKKVSSIRPATVILMYDVKMKSDTVSWREFENSIFIDISKCKKIEKNDHMNIIVIIITNTASFNFDYINDEKDKIYSVKKVLDAKNLFYLNGLENLKNISKKFTTHFINITVNYYRQIKKKLKIRLNESKDFREYVIKSNIKLGVLSLIKNKKKNFKYFESAYANLVDLSDSIRNYAYGKDIKMNYFEIKSVADWLYFKLLQIKLSENKHIINIINSFNIHMQFFSRFDNLVYNNLEEKERHKASYDIFLIIEYYWKIIRLEGFAKMLDEISTNFKDDVYIKNNLNFPGYYNMLAAFNVKRLQKILQEIMPQLETHQNIYSLNSKIIFRDSKFYGRQYKIYEQIDPLTERSIEFDRVFYLKNFINVNNINKNSLTKRLIENLSKAEKMYRKYLIITKEINISTLTIYFNFLSLVELDDFNILNPDKNIENIIPSIKDIDSEKKSNLEKIKTLFKSFIHNNTLYKFKDLYIKFLDSYNQVLKLDNFINDNRENNEQILQNLINISGVRNLSDTEQNIFNKLIFSENISYKEKPLKQKFSIKKKNSILKFEYTISNINPQIFDIFETNYILTSDLEYGIKIKTISIIYNNPDRNKNYFEFTYELSKSNPISLKNVFQVKESDNNLIVKTIRCELQTENENVIFLEMHVKHDPHKTLIVKQIDNQVIEFKYKKHLQVGLEQFYKFEMEILRKDRNISIENLNLNFRIIEKDIKDQFGRITMINTSSSAKNLHQRSSSLNEKFAEKESKKPRDEIAFSLFDPNINFSDNLINTVNHEIILKKKNFENDELTYLKNCCRFNFLHLEEREICEFLIKFNEKGNFYMLLEFDYKIIKKEILDDFSIMKHTGEINIEVVNSFTPKFEIFSSSYMSLQKIKIFPSGKMLKINLSINNEIKEDFKIENVNLIAKIPEINLSSTFVKLLDKDDYKNLNENCDFSETFLEIFNFKKSTEFTIPITFNCPIPYSGSLGNVEMFYSNKGLHDFYPHLNNKINFVIPEYNIKNFEIDLSYSIPKSIKNKENFDFKILIKNSSEERKRLMLLVDSTQYFIINGRVKEKILMNQNENLEKILNLIPLNFGKLKLPAFKIMEFPYDSNNFENKIYSIYYLPENIHIY